MKGDKGVPWTPLSAAELNAFVAIFILMGINKLPKISDYWSQTPGLGNSWISDTMSRNRFFKINKYIHLHDVETELPRGHANFDSLQKIRRVLNHMKQKFGQFYIPRKCLSIDEAMIAYKGRVRFKQYVPSKPTRWGIKVFELCDSVSGYCLDFDVYTGKDRKPSNMGLGYDVVKMFMERYLHKFHHVFYDRFFSGLPICEYLLANNTYVSGTIMLNRRGLPKKAKTTKLGRGASVLYQKNQSNVVLTTWMDKRQVNLLSSGSTNEVDENGKPLSIINYNRYMGGVDLNDQLCHYYRVGRKCLKWWRYVLWFTVNTAITNAWILYKSSPHYNRRRKINTHEKFRLELRQQLRDGFTSRKRAGRPVQQHRIPARVIASVNGHNMVKAEGRPKACQQCRLDGRRTQRGYPVKTVCICIKCNTRLCQGQCFMRFH